jgi:hypothetical protein
MKIISSEVYIMRVEATNVELTYLIDEFLWEEEIVELGVASKCFDSIKSVIGSEDETAIGKWILDALPSSSDRTDSFTMILALEYIFLGPIAGNTSVIDAVGTIRTKSIVQDVSNSMFEKLCAQLSSLIAYVGTNQVSLTRDTSRISLLRQVSTVSSTSSQYEPSILSSKIRVCLNMLYVFVILHQHEDRLLALIQKTGLHETLLQALRSHVDNVIPIRKVVVFIFKLLSFHGQETELSLPSNTPSLAGGSSASSPLTVLMNFVPLLSLPKLSDFRSFIALSVHANSLVNWVSPDGVRPRPSAIEEGIEISKAHMRAFIESYHFHEAEIELLKTDPSLLTAFQEYLALVSEGRVKKFRSNLLKPSTKKSEANDRFALPELAKHMIANYQISAGISSESDASESDIPVVHDAFQSCQSWLGRGASEQELIDAIAEAAVPLPINYRNSVSTARTRLVPSNQTVFLNKVYEPAVLTECLVILLKILLSSCRGAVDPVLSPTNHPSFDLDRDHLLTMLERFEMVSPPSTPRDCCLRRNYEIISCAVAGILLLLLKLHTEQSELVQRTIVSNNGCLVLLKLITSYPNTEMVPGTVSSIFSEFRDNKSWSFAIPQRLPNALYRSLKSLYILCKNNVPRIKKYLIHYKVAVVLKRFFAFPNVAILKIAYKLFKIQMRFLGKKWKILHIKLLSCCYNATNLEIIDDWIVNDPEIADVQGPSDDLLNDSHMMWSPERFSVKKKPAIPEFDMPAYIEALNKLNFEKKEDIVGFCQRFSEPMESFFGSRAITNFSDWLAYTVGSTAALSG